MFVYCFFFFSTFEIKIILFKHLNVCKHLYNNAIRLLYFSFHSILGSSVIYIYIYIRGAYDKLPDFFFVWELLLIVHAWNSSPLRSNLPRLQCTCCTVPTNSGRPHGSPLVWVCQWPSSQPLSSPQLSHNDSLWA